MLRDVKTVILLVGLVLKCVLGENQTENSIIIMTPHVWICDQYATQTMLIDTVSDKLKAENVNVVVTLKSRSDSSNVAFNVRETVRANSNGFHRFDFELPDRIEHGFYDVEVNVIGDDGYSFNGSLANLECRNSQNGIYIITDKPVYKDSEKVRIRVVNIDSNLLPVSDETASIYIMDPNKNRVQQFLDVEFTNGLIDGLEFKLTDRPIYGDWEIKVAFNDTEKSINFNVKEYVLPKFDFKLNLPEYIIRNSKEIKGSVEAKYTYGKPLDGDVKVRLENLFYGPYVVNNQTSYQSGTVVQYEQVYTLNKGKIDFTLPFKASDYSYNYKVNVTVTDKYSDESSSKESMLNILWNEFYARLDNYDFNPNQTNYLKVDLVQPNEKPYAFKKINVTIMQKSVDYSISYNYRSLSNDSFFLTSDVNGRLNFSFFVEPNVTNIEITLVSGDDSSQIAYVYLYKRIENQIQPPTPVEKLIIRSETNDTLELDTQLALKLIRNDTGESCVNARYFVLGKLQILMDSVIELCEETTIYIELGAQYAPYSTVVVYYVDSTTKNVTVASYEININNFFRNHLEISFSSNTTQPGEDVEIELYTRENSLVSLCIIDKSVELLRQPNELTINDINTQMLSTRLYGYYPPYPSPSSNVNQFGRMIFPRPGYWQLTESLRKLHNQGLIVASDLDDLFANFTEFQGPIVPLADGPINAPPALAQDEAEATSTANFGGSGGAAAAARPQGAAAVVPRSNFQETWIWDTYDVKNSTQKFIYSKIPDTITSWVASGFSINSEYGLAIANKTSITTFKNFFVSMILPPSLVRGEILHLQIVVYNYFDHDLKNVLVVLSKTDDFKEANGSRLFNITNDLEVTIPLIESQNAQTVEFLISPVNIGQLPLTVKAVSDEAGDGETRKLKVKAEGIEQASTQALLIELDNTTALTHDFHIDFPANIVKDSEFCSIQVIGDLLGPSLNNLNRLVSKPYGCGEQNMVTLTPNIYALNYLYAIADPNSPSKNKISNVDKLINDAKSNILFGFQNQLKYVLDDGSFSAFGKSDVNGSTWLTSFVVKSFAQARKYAPEIDNRVIQKAVKFLIEQQKPNGAFAENGRVIHSDMQGGVSSEQTITAYVAIALIESQLIDEITTESIKSALTYLEREAPKIKDQDAYALGIVTYALTLGNSDDAKKYYELFQSKSIRSSDGNINWSKNPNNPESSSDVELTSYGLLLTLLRNDLSTSLSIVKYLVGKSSSLGSYSNTQDTVLALQALSQFGIRSSESGGSGTKSVDITTSLIDSSSNTLASKTFKTTEENSIVLQTWDLPSCRAKVSLKAQGSGTALFQLIASYNIPKNPVKPVFTIRQNTTKSATNSVNIKTCATYNKDSTSAKSESTGMTLIEATLLSGYEANKQELDGLVGNVKYLKLVEIKDQQVVVFYLDQLDDSNELCVEWKMHKVNDVDNLQAVPVKVYDYYQSNLEYSILFTPPSN